MDLTPLATLLEAANVGKIGESIFMHNMPSSAKNAVMIRGKFTGTKIDHYLPGFYKTDVMLVARAATYEQGKDLIFGAIAALTLSEITVGEYYIRYSRPDTLPSVYPLSDGDNIEFAVRMNLAFNVS